MVWSIPETASMGSYGWPVREGILTGGASGNGDEMCHLNKTTPN